MRIKVNVLIWALCSLLVTLSFCKENDEPNLIELDSSEIMGQLECVENPFRPANDTILCLLDVQCLYCKTYNSGYCSYLKKLLSGMPGTLYASDEHFAGPYTIEFIPDSHLRLYPMRDGKFISVVDSQKGEMADSISLSVIHKTGSKITTSNVLVFTRPREQHNDTTCIYRGDYVVFHGDDHMQPVFVTDTITPSNDQIICFEASRGPIMTLTGQEVKQ